MDSQIWSYGEIEPQVYDVHVGPKICLEIWIGSPVNYGSRLHSPLTHQELELLSVA